MTIAQLRNGAGESATGETNSIDAVYPSRRDSPGKARAALGALEPGVGHNLLARLRLVVTELVANSVEHSHGTSIHFDLLALPWLIRGEVTDDGRVFLPAIGEELNPLRTRGWGLFLVRRFSDRWGMLEGGCGVWFEIDR